MWIVSANFKTLWDLSNLKLWMWGTDSENVIGLPQPNLSLLRVYRFSDTDKGIWLVEHFFHRWAHSNLFTSMHCLYLLIAYLHEQEIHSEQC